MDQPGVRRAKAARVEVERREVGVEVDVEPLASGGPGVLRREMHGPCSYARALVSAVRLRVDEKRMISAVRHHVDESDHPAAGVAGDDPTETVRTDSIPPADLGVPAEGFDELH